MHSSSEGCTSESTLVGGSTVGKADSAAWIDSQNMMGS